MTVDKISKHRLGRPFQGLGSPCCYGNLDWHFLRLIFRLSRTLHDVMKGATCSSPASSRNLTAFCVALDVGTLPNMVVIPTICTLPWQLNAANIAIASSAGGINCETFQVRKPVLQETNRWDSLDTRISPEDTKAVQLFVVSGEVRTDARICVDDQLFWRHRKCGLQPGKSAHQMYAQATRTCRHF